MKADDQSNRKPAVETRVCPISAAGFSLYRQKGPLAHLEPESVVCRADINHETPQNAKQ